MKIISINLGINGSTGKIMKGVHNKAREGDYEFLMLAPLGEKSSESDVYYIGNRICRRINAYLGIITGLDGCFSMFATIKALKRIRSFKPDVIHLHNLHNNYINLPMLFSFIKKKNIRVIWTLHDCWAFTGHCPHFVCENCYKWQTGCKQCPRYKEYPKSLFDNSRFMWKLKHKWFTGVRYMTIVTPSNWLAGLASESYLKGYPVKVIKNGIDLEIFKYTSSDFKEKYYLGDKKIVLGVAFCWSNKKGLDVFVHLANTLPNDYQVVLIGTDDKVDALLPPNIISIHRTQNQQELAEIYSAADVFVIPTREENYPTVNMEALACGTPVLTFRTGGSPEMLDETCGSVVDCDDVDAMEREIIRICTEKPYSKEACIKKAQEFDKNERFKEYIELYAEVIQR